MIEEAVFLSGAEYQEYLTKSGSSSLSSRCVPQRGGNNEKSPTQPLFTIEETAAAILLGVLALVFTASLRRTCFVAPPATDIIDAADPRLGKAIEPKNKVSLLLGKLEVLRLCGYDGRPQPANIVCL